MLERCGVHTRSGWSRLQKLPKKEKTCSELVLFAVRRVHWDTKDEVPLADTKAIPELTLHVAVSRERTRHVQGVWEGDQIHLIQLCPLSPHLRMFKSVQETYRLPKKIANVICGTNCPPVLTDSEMRARLDPGCLEYLQRVRETTGLIDDSQYEALQMALGSIGTGEQESSSISLIQGPPGTGKTTLLNIMIGALLHHSVCGHVGQESVHALRNELPEDGILSRSVNKHGFRILVCCGSNQAVDNILRRMDSGGIPDGAEGSLYPQAVRLARQGYEYGDLQPYSIDVKALPFDKFIHNKTDENRKCASSKAKKSFSQELIIGFVTNSSSGGARLKNLKIGWDIILEDEAAQCWEPETLIPMTTAMMSNQTKRCHIVLSGDPAQLLPMVLADMLMKRANHGLNYSAQMISLFERLQKSHRAPFKMLIQQYRMHPTIAKRHSSVFCNGAVQSPLPASKFEEPYNLGWESTSRRFAPVTLIDTSGIPSRRELNDQKGSVCNPTEVNIMDEVLNDVKRLSGDRFDRLRKQIAAIVPYRAQLDQAKRAFASFGKYKEDSGASSQGSQMELGTVDYSFWL